MVAEPSLQLTGAESGQGNEGIDAERALGGQCCPNGRAHAAVGQAAGRRRKVFGKEKVTMFEMNKLLAQHLK